MTRYRVYAKIIGTKFLGEVDAPSPDVACAKMEGDAYVNLCHQCSHEIDDAQCDEMFAEEITK